MDIPWDHKLCTHPRGAAKVMGAICTESTVANEKRIVDHKDILVMKCISSSTGMK